MLRNPRFLSDSAHESPTARRLGQHLPRHRPLLARPILAVAAGMYFAAGLCESLMRAILAQGAARGGRERRAN